MKNLLPFLLILFIFDISFGQKDSTFLFKQQKGKLSLPIKYFDNATDNNNREVTVSGSVSFEGVHSDSVMSVFEGKVILLYKFEDSVYSVVTKYGNYLLLYYGIIKPLIKPGDYIETHQLIGKTKLFSDMEIALMLKGKEVPIYNWFKWE